MIDDKLIIGLAGKAGSGKDTVADRWSTTAPFGRVPFTEPLKDAMRVIFGLTQAQLYTEEGKNAVDKFWDASPRELLQKFGTDCCRQSFRDDIWVRSAERRIAGLPFDNIVITDVRFINEAEAIKSWDGYLVKVDRPGYSRLTEEQQQHESETALDDWAEWDAVISNEGSLEELVEKASEVLETLKARHKEAKVLGVIK